MHVDKVTTSWQFWCKRPDMSKVSKRGSWKYLCNMLRKNCCSCSCSVVTQNITGNPVIFTVTSFLGGCSQKWVPFSRSWNPRYIRVNWWKKLIFLHADFARWYKFKNAKRFFNDYWEGVLKNWPNRLDYGALKRDVSHTWFD